MKQQPMETFVNKGIFLLGCDGAGLVELFGAKIVWIRGWSWIWSGSGRIALDGMEWGRCSSAVKKGVKKKKRKARKEKKRKDKSLR